jgi:hypothetical protein
MFLHPLGVTAWTAETGFLVSDEDIDAVHEEVIGSCRASAR